MAAKVRIKNDIILFFDLYTGEDQQPENLSDIVNLSVQLKADVFGHVIIPIFSVTGNRIRIDVPAELQSVRGMYTLIVSYNRPNPEGTPPLNTFTIDQPAFELVARSIEAETGAEGEPTVQTIQLNGVIGVAGPVGPIGPKGETGDDAYEVWVMQPGNEGKTIEDYFIFLQTPAYEAGLTAVDAKNIAVQKAQEAEQSATESFQSKQASQQAEINSKSAESGSIEAANLSIAAKNASEGARDISVQAAGVSTTKAQEAFISAQNAATSEQKAADSKNAAKISEDAAKLSETNAAASEASALEAKGYLESRLFHYISHDEISVRVAIGTQVKVSESTTGYPSVILELQTL